MSASPLFQPLVAMVAWSVVVMIWMYAYRIPAILKAKMQFNPNAIRGAEVATLPPSVRWKADNYNNLMEQPTLFYAVAIVLALIGEHTRTNVALAWAYVGLRVIHSLVQSLFNHVTTRFSLFMLASVALLGLVINAVLAVF